MDNNAEDAAEAAITDFSFEYNNSGRMVRVTRKLISQDGTSTPFPDQDLKYYYDIRGNRQEDPSNPGYPGLIKYDDKPSIYSLHHVWRIKYRDYSRNSTMNGQTYNEQGLPTQFADSSRTYFQPFLNAEEGSVVSYDCENIIQN